MNFSKISNFAGVITGVLFLVLAIGFSANNPMAFLNISGLLIVFGGTLTAILVSYPLKEVIPALKQAKVVAAPHNIDIQQDIKQILHFSSLWFRQRFAQIDADLEKLNDHFLKRGLQMVRDRESHEDGDEYSSINESHTIDAFNGKYANDDFNLLSLEVWGSPSI